MEDLDLTSFALGPAIEKARKVLREHATITLTKQGQAALVQLLQNQKQLTQSIKNLMALPDLPVRQ